MRGRGRGRGGASCADVDVDEDVGGDSSRVAREEAGAEEDGPPTAGDHILIMDMAVVMGCRTSANACFKLSTTCAPAPATRSRQASRRNKRKFGDISA